MGRSVRLAVVLALVVPAAYTWQTNRNAAVISRHAQMMKAHEVNNARDFDHNDDRTWRELMAKLPKLRAKLAEAWQGMGMSPEAAKVVADAYVPKLGAHFHHVPLRGKSDQEVAQMMQVALKEKRYMDADQLLIDFQRRKLRLAGTSAEQTED